LHREEIEAGSNGGRPQLRGKKKKPIERRKKKSSVSQRKIGGTLRGRKQMPFGNIHPLRIRKGVHGMQGAIQEGKEGPERNILTYVTGKSITTGENLIRCHHESPKN